MSEYKIKEAGTIQIHPATKNPFNEQLDSIKAHAVEVLAKKLDAIEQTGCEYISWEEEVQDMTKVRLRAEARALLGWEE